MLNSSDHSSEQHNYPQVLQQLVNRYPFVFWGTIWGFLVLIGTVAAVGLLNPGRIESDKSVPKPLVSTILESTARQTPLSNSPITSSPENSSPKEGLPLTLFLGLAFGCAAGSWLVTQAFRQSTQRRQVIKPSKPTRRKKRRRPVNHSQVSQPPQSEEKKQAIQTLDSPQPVAYDSDTEVTVVPDQEKNPLDQEEQSLAEMLDLRKRESLASIMRRSLSTGRDISLSQTSSYLNNK
ncbi:MAG: hypothetical protein RH949_13505 [Coleofasciculus sp. A1-SPW-01]|uniref:hypothetical protein n=1 Tax=Coleofasciculus sp. A1-SPW-01 TaxID=3070819 RepID=UPI0032F0FE26